MRKSVSLVVAMARSSTGRRFYRGQVRETASKVSDQKITEKTKCVRGRSQLLRESLGVLAVIQQKEALRFSPVEPSLRGLTASELSG